MTTPPDILARIAKLFATAAPGSGATEHERNTAMRLATRYMDTHRITEQAIRDAMRKSVKPAGHTDAEDMDTLPWGVRVTASDGWLAMAVGAVVGCGVFTSFVPIDKDSPMVKGFIGYGLPADLAVGAALYCVVRDEMIATARRWAAERNITGGLRNRLVRSFTDGYAVELLNRARTEQRARERSTDTVDVGTPGCTALVLIGDAARAHSEALAGKKKKLGLGKGRATRRYVDSSARAQGAAAARSVSLSRAGVR